MKMRYGMFISQRRRSKGRSGFGRQVYIIPAGTQSCIYFLGVIYPRS
jgi:hypothetical protein